MGAWFLSQSLHVLAIPSLLCATPFQLISMPVPSMLVFSSPSRPNSIPIHGYSLPILSLPFPCRLFYSFHFQGISAYFLFLTSQLIGALFPSISTLCISKSYLLHSPHCPLKSSLLQSNPSQSLSVGVVSSPSRLVSGRLSLSLCQFESLLSISQSYLIFAISFQTYSFLLQVKSISGPLIA